jgi:ankyrin repeat protein
VVQLLLELGADVAARDIKQNTPLMIATSVQAVKLLLAAGADVTAVGDNGQTVLHCLATAGACAGTACLLLKAGADPTVVSYIDGNSVPAHSAGMRGHFALEDYCLVLQMTTVRSIPLLLAAQQAIATAAVVMAAALAAVALTAVAVMVTVL